MLVIYYDSPNEASDTYLKWLTKDCKEKNIKYIIVDNFEEYYDKYYNCPTLPMMPIKDRRIIGYLRQNNELDIDNVSGLSSDYTDATAQGIFNYIKETRVERGTIVAVIGRGKVGKSLIDMLIDYGYTVFEFNSKSFTKKMFNVCYNYAHIVVGLSSENVFDDIHSEMLSNKLLLIDASNTFDTKNKLRCGKWTRDVILSRV